MLVGAYLTQALLINEGYSGLAAGLKILNDMVENHWQGLFPPAQRMRARGTAITWLAERAGALITEKVPTAKDAEAVIEAAKYIRLLDGSLAEKMGDAAPMLTDLSRPLKNYKQSAEAEMTQAAPAPALESAPAPAAQAESVTSAAPEASAVSAPSTPATQRAVRPEKTAVAAPEIGEIASDADAKKVLRLAQDTARKVSTYWSAQKLSDPRAYRVARVATWMLIEDTPPANGGVTQVMPPAADRVKFFEAQIEKAEYSSVLPELEKTLARAPFWIDGQNMVVTVLRAMGSEYEKAAASVIGELSQLLQRIPGLLNLSFSDQTPFASDQTRMWLEAEVLNASGSSSPAAAATAGASAWDEALAEARKKAASGGNEAAMQIFQNGIANAGQVRDKFYWRCALAELLLQTGDALAASNLLKPMTEQIDVYHLTEWEPELLARIYKLLYQSYQKQQGKKKDDAVLNELVASAYHQLCWFDPVIALTMKGEK